MEKAESREREEKRSKEEDKEEAKDANGSGRFLLRQLLDGKCIVRLRGGAHGATKREDTGEEKQSNGFEGEGVRESE